MAFRFLAKGLIFTLVFILGQQFPVEAEASPRDPFSANLKGDFEKLIQLSRAHFIAGNLNPTLSNGLFFSGYLPSVGRVNFKLDKLETKKWPAYIKTSAGVVPDESKIILLSGTARLAASVSRSIAASVFEERGKYYLFLRLRQLRGKSGAHFLIKAPLNEVTEPTLSIPAERDAEVRRIPNHFLKTLKFDDLKNVKSKAGAQSTDTAADGSPTKAALATAPASTRIFLLATEADPSYTNLYGSSANNQIASLVSAANVIYERDISAKLKLNFQLARDPASQGGVSADSLLTGFVNGDHDSHYLGTADIYHLFSTRNFDGSTIGLAYVAEACVRQNNGDTYAYGVSQDINPAINYLVLAHEIGHNLGAEHDSQTQPPSLMYPSADPSQNYFSQISKNEIASHLGQYGSFCLGGFENPDGPTPTPTPGVTPTPGPTNNPSPEPTGTGPGGDGGGDITSPPWVVLTSSLSRSGEFIVAGSAERKLENCTIELVAAKDRSAQSLIGTFGSYTFSGLEFMGSGAITRSARRDRKGKATIYLQARFTCPGMAIFTSEVAKLNASSIKSSQSPIALKSWIKTLAHATEFEVLTP